MNKSDLLFFSLVQVSIGKRELLSSIPSQKEWVALYELSQKQSLTGICFAGIQILHERDEKQIENLPKELLLQWYGEAAQLHDRNKTINDYCVKLQQKLSEDGFRSCILKGQGIATYYNDSSLQIKQVLESPLSVYRQPGDIDILIDASREEIIQYVANNFHLEGFDYKHLHARIFPDVSVEMHFCPSVPQRITVNRRWIKFVKSCQLWDDTVNVNGANLHIPSLEFNLVYILLHIFMHMLGEELTMKQYLDFYYVVRKAYNSGCDLQKAYDVAQRLGMKKFAQGVMWVLQQVFGLERQHMICEPDAKEGSFLLVRLIENKHERAKGMHGSFMWKLNVMKGQTTKNLHLITHYPLEVFMQPVWLVYHFFWKRIWKLQHRHIFISGQRQPD